MVKNPKLGGVIHGMCILIMDVYIYHIRQGYCYDTVVIVAALILDNNGTSQIIN